MQKNTSHKLSHVFVSIFLNKSNRPLITKAKKLCLLAFVILVMPSAQASVLFESTSAVDKQCQNIIESLNDKATQSAISKKLGGSSNPAWAMNQFSLFEKPLISANNLNFTLLLAADVHPDKEIQERARICLPLLKEAMDGYYALPSMAERLASISQADNHQHDASLDGAINRYLALISTAKNTSFVEKCQQATIKARAFRAGANNEIPENYIIDERCEKGLPKSKVNKWKNDLSLNIPSASKSVNYALARMEDESCRQSLYAQHESRFKGSNENLLLAMLTARNSAANAKNKKYWADIAFENTMLPSVKYVDEFLVSLNNPQNIEAPWNVRFNKRNATADATAKKAKQVKQAKHETNGAINKEDKTRKQDVNSLTPETAKKGLFKLLEKEFSLKVKPLNLKKQELWFANVEAYELYDLKKFKDGKPKYYGKFYLDLHPRAGKYKKNRHRAIKRGVSNIAFEQKAEGALILNLPEKSWKQKHIKSFFHEFGHLLHNMVSVQKTHIEAGISMERDLVEMPAKWFEWLSFDPDVQKMMFDHVIVDNVKADEGVKYQLRLYKAAYALAYHQTDPSHESFEAINTKLFKDYTGYEYIPDSGSQYSFTHLATYGPRYYTYLWSEKMALRLLQDYKNDAFSARNFFDLYLSIGSQYTTLEMLSHLYDRPLTLPEVIQWVSNPNYQFSEK